jgi:hypothetical protein
MVILGKYTYTTICAWKNTIAFFFSLFYLGKIELPSDTVPLKKDIVTPPSFFYTPSSMVQPGRILLVFSSIATLENTYSTIRCPF